MHCFGGSLPLPSQFQCVRADQDRGRQAGRQEHASSSVQLGAELCRSPYCSTDRGIVWGQRKPQKLASLQRSWADMLGHRLCAWDVGCRYACLGPSTLQPAQTVPEGTDWPSISLCQPPVWELVCLNPIAVFLDSPAGVILRAWHLLGAQVPVLLLNSSVLYGATTTRCCAQTASRHVTHGSRVAVTFHLPLNPVSFPV